jgi:hypothetical protein
MMHGEVDDFIDLFPVADIAGESESPFGISDSSTRSIRAAGITGKKYNIGAMLHEDFGNRFSNTHGSARHHGHFSGKIHVVLLFCLRHQVK